MYKIRDNKWNRRFCKWMASLLMAALVVNQSSILVLAEEITEETGADTVTVTDEETENPGTGEETEDSDAGGDENTDEDADTAPDTDTDEETEGSDAGEGEDADADTDEVSDADAEDEGNVSLQDNEAGDVVGEDVVSPVAEEKIFTFNKVIYEIISENDRQVEVKGHEDGTSVSGELVIPPEVFDGTYKYEVVRIGRGAFDECSGLTSITIPDSVTSIGQEAFYKCINLTSITIPNGVTRIETATFRYCSSLTSIAIPNSVASIGKLAFGECTSIESITIPDSVTSIGECAFEFCTALTYMTIPASVTSIGKCGFANCLKLTGVTILNDGIDIGEYAFWWCDLNSFQIAVSENSTGTPTIASWCFEDCPDDRILTFLTEDGTMKLSDTTTPTLAAAVEAYDAADGIDDGMWYGWKLEKDPDVPDVTEYQVTISVEIDDSPWSNCGKTFALSADHNTFITDLDVVPAGTYTIYDTTGAEDSTGYVDTGVPVEVKDGAVEVEVNYYTVTFYNGENVFSGQIVPKGAKVNPPPATPTKEGHTFYRWATSEDSSTEFDFKTPITAKTDIYASWIADAEELYRITVSAGPGGSVSPDRAEVKSGANQRFTITPEEGYRVSSVLVDGVEQLNNAQTVDYAKAGISDAENNAKYYDFENVTSDHTLSASFEAIQGGDNSGIGDGDDSGSGGTDGGNSGSGSSGGDTDNSSDSGSTDGNTDSRDAYGNITSVISSDMSVASDAGIVKTGSTAPASPDREPKTGDATHMEIYATIAMIAGLSYILLYFADGKSGMTEEEKKEIVAALVNWAKKGSWIRKYAALAVIFLVLVYYHSIGKRTSADWKEVYAK